MGTLNSQCARGTSRLDGFVEGAINQLVAQNPALFNVNDQAGPGGYLVKDPTAYYNGVITNLLAQGLCANFDGSQVQVKESNDYSEQYDILTSTNHVRRAPGSYRATCTPAIFPVPDSDFIAYVRVSFYGIRCPDGVTAPSNNAGLLPVGCVGWVTATAKKKDGTDVDERLVGTEISWNQRAGWEQVTMEDYPGQPFNKILTGVRPGNFSICATLQGVEGCLNGVVPTTSR